MQCRVGFDYVLAGDIHQHHHFSAVSKLCQQI